jgi:hypothetical protein
MFFLFSNQRRKGYAHRRMSSTSQKMRQRERRTGFKVKLVDFGNVREIGFQDWASHNTGGTLEYLSPERAPGFKKIKKATRDIFSRSWKLEHANEFLERLRELRYGQLVAAVAATVLDTYRTLISQRPPFPYVRRRGIIFLKEQKRVQAVTKMLIRRYIVEYVPLASYIAGTENNFEIVARHLQHKLSRINSADSVSLEENAKWESEVTDVDVMHCIQNTDAFVCDLLNAINEERSRYSSILTTSSATMRRVSTFVEAYLRRHFQSLWCLWRYFETLEEETVREWRQRGTQQTQVQDSSSFPQSKPQVFAPSIRETDDETEVSEGGVGIITVDDGDGRSMDRLLEELKELQLREEAAWDFIRPELTADPKWDVFALGVGNPNPNLNPNPNPSTSTSTSPNLNPNPNPNPNLTRTFLPDRRLSCTNCCTILWGRIPFTTPIRTILQHHHPLRRL